MFRQTVASNGFHGIIRARLENINVESWKGDPDLVNDHVPIWYGEIAFIRKEEHCKRLQVLCNKGDIILLSLSKFWSEEVGALHFTDLLCAGW